MRTNNLWRVIAHRHWISLKFLDKEIRLCARCTGYVTGFYIFSTLNTIFSLTVFSNINVAYQLISSTILVMPLAFDWITHTWELRKSNNRLRITTGFILGLGVALLRFSIATFNSKIILCASLSLGIIILGLLGKVIRKQIFSQI